METVLSLERRINFDLKKCFICQKRKRPDKLSDPHQESFVKLKIAAEERKSLGEKDNIFERIDKYLENGNTLGIKWHRACYCNFIKPEIIARLKP